MKLLSPRKLSTKGKRRLGATQNMPTKTSWEPVAHWYKGYTNEKGTLLGDVVHISTIRLLGVTPGMKVLDVACGEGSLSRLLAKAGAEVTGFDASPSLVQQAKQKGPRDAHYEVADATNFATVFPPASFDAATCTLALQNMERFEEAIRHTATVLKPGAPFVFVLNHPCFRVPRQSGWGWDEQRKLQYRRVDKYLSPYGVDMLAHPGADPTVKTYSYHRPLSAYMAALAKYGFVIAGLEEWVSNRESKPGGHSRAENAAREEIPMFLAIKAIKHS